MRRKSNKRVRPTSKNDVIVPEKQEEVGESVEENTKRLQAAWEEKEKQKRIEEGKRFMANQWKLLCLACLEAKRKKLELKMVRKPPPKPRVVEPPPPPKNPKEHPAYRLYSRLAQATLKPEEWDSLGNHAWRLEREKLIRRVGEMESPTNGIHSTQVS